MNESSTTSQEETFQPADIEDQDVLDGAWDLASNAEINILSDKELMGAIEVIPSPSEGYRTIVGAWWGSSAHGGEEFSFDIIVDEDWQGKGVGRMLFDSAMSEARDGVGAERVCLEVHNDKVAAMARKAGFAHGGGSQWSKCVDESDTPESVVELGGRSCGPLSSADQSRGIV